MDDDHSQPVGEYPDIPAGLTLPERLDAAQTGEEFAEVLNDLFRALEIRRNQ